MVEDDVVEDLPFDGGRGGRDGAPEKGGAEGDGGITPMRLEKGQESPDPTRLALLARALSDLLTAAL
jgi:hypothetical protein